MLLRFSEQRSSTPRHSIAFLNDFFTYACPLTPEAQLWKKAMQSDEDTFVSYHGDRYFNANKDLQTIMEERFAQMLSTKKIQSIVVLYITDGMPERLVSDDNSLASSPYLSTMELLNAGAPIMVATTGRLSSSSNYNNSVADFVSTFEALRMVSLDQPLPSSLTGENVIYLVKENDNVKTLYSLNRQHGVCELWLGGMQNAANQERLREINTMLSANGVATLEAALDELNYPARLSSDWGLR